MRIRAFSGGDFDPASRLVGAIWYSHHEAHAMWYGADELCAHLARSDAGFVVTGDDDRLLGLILVASPNVEDRNAEMRRHWRQQKQVMAAMAGALGVDLGADGSQAMIAEENALLDGIQRDQGMQGLVALVVVDPAARGQGLGRMLLDAGLGWLSDHGADELRLVTDTGCDWQIYEHLGMRRVAGQASTANPDEEIYVYQGRVPELRARLSPSRGDADEPAPEIVPADDGLEARLGAIIDDHAARAGVEVRSYRYHVEADGHVLGGISAWAMGPDLHIDMLAFEESARKQGLGAQLIARVEEDARRDGCTTASVDTFSFQAPDYYPAQGYAEVFRYRLDDGTERIYFTKRL